MPSAAEIFKDWWPVVAGLGGLVLAGVGGWVGHRQAQAKNTWRLDALDERQRTHEANTKEQFAAAHSDIAALKADAAEARVNFGILQTTLTQMRDALMRIEDRLDGKQDK